MKLSTLPNGKNKLKVLSISLDTSLLDSTFSNSFLRQVEYAENFDEFKIVVLNKHKRLASKKYQNITVTPTNSITRWFYPFDVLRIIFLAKENYDIITTQDPYMTGLVGLMISKIFKIPLNIQLHSEDIFSSEWLWRSPLHYIMKKTARYVLSRADSVRHLTQTQADFLKSHNFIGAKNLLFQAPVFVELENFKRTIQNTTPKKFVVIARLSWEKHICLALYSFKKLQAHYPNSTLAIIGDGPERDYLKAITQKINLTDSVSFGGKIDHKDIPTTVSKYDVLVMTSFYEGWPLVVAEAMAAGVGVITVESASSGQLIEHNKTALIAQSSPDHVSQAMSKLIDSPVLFNQLRANAQKKVLHDFSKDVLINKFIQGLSKTFAEYKKNT